MACVYVFDYCYEGNLLCACFYYTNSLSKGSGLGNFLPDLHHIICYRLRLLLLPVGFKI